MNQGNQHKISDLQDKINSAESRKNELLVELSKMKSLMIVVEDQLIEERLIIDKLKEQLEWEVYQTSFL